MSAEDQDRWDARYQAGAYAHRHHPSQLLATWLADNPPNLTSGAQPKALDVACGAGRNSLFLAQHGYWVLGLDISAEAIAQATRKALANKFEHRTQFLQHDLDRGLVSVNESNNYQKNSFDLICVFRYLDLSLIPELVGRLAPHGVLMVEVNLQSRESVAGPGTHHGSRFRAQPGALGAAISDATQGAAVGYSVALTEEGLFVDPDGKDAALARVIVQRDGSRTN